MVKEIALRSGWDDSGFCYVCRSVVPHEKWSLGDVEHMDRMRHQGWPWSKIAAHMVKHGHPHASEAKVLQAWERGRGKLARMQPRQRAAFMPARRLASWASNGTAAT
jgi:hypothetical protein